jgi:hypothetical protein
MFRNRVARRRCAGNMRNLRRTEHALTEEAFEEKGSAATVTSVPAKPF